MPHQHPLATRLIINGGGVAPTQPRASPPQGLFKVRQVLAVDGVMPPGQRRPADNGAFRAPSLPSERVVAPRCALSSLLALTLNRP